jgi:hypothetical protein
MIPLMVKPGCLRSLLVWQDAAPSAMPRRTGVTNFRSASKRVFSLRSDQRGGLLLVKESRRACARPFLMMAFISAVVFQKLTSAQTSTGPVKVDRNSKIIAM